MPASSSRMSSQQARRTRRRQAPLQLRLLRTAFRTLGHIAPQLMARYAYRIWFATRRSPEPQREKRYLETAETIPVHHNDKPLAVYSWGEGPIILLVHGWNGRGAQLGAFVEPLVNTSFRVVTFDAPAHGHTPGNSTSIFDISAAIETIIDHVGELHGIIAHSFGLPCTALAASRGAPISHVVGISTPASMEELILKFRRALHIPDKVITHFRRRFEYNYGADIWQRVSADSLAADMNIPALIIHDEDDHDIHWHSGKAVADAWPGARFVTTHGLGHRRILRNQNVVKLVTEYFQSPDSVKITSENL